MGAIMSLFQIHSYTTRIARGLADNTDDEGFFKTEANFPFGYELNNTVAALVTFRAPNAYRSESAQELRKAVADVVRRERRS